jgi:hypothetical protein
VCIWRVHRSSSGVLVMRMQLSPRHTLCVRVGDWARQHHSLHVAAHRKRPGGLVCVRIGQLRQGDAKETPTTSALPIIPLTGGRFSAAVHIRHTHRPTTPGASWTVSPSPGDAVRTRTSSTVPGAKAAAGTSVPSHPSHSHTNVESGRMHVCVCVCVCAQACLCA